MPDGIAISGLFAFPGHPPAIGQCVNSAILKVNDTGLLRLEAWQQVDNWGRPLIEPILSRIGEHNILVADITRLNFNVTFEIGYGIGSRKRVLLASRRRPPGSAGVAVEV
jgi:hypothetical protein